MFTDFSCIYSNSSGNCFCKDNGDIPFCAAEFFCKHYEKCEYCTKKDNCQHFGHSGTGIKCIDE